MGLFNNLLEKLGIKKAESTSAGTSSGTAAKTSAAAPAKSVAGRPLSGDNPHNVPHGAMHGGPGKPPAGGPPPQGMPAMVDVAGKLDKLAAASQEKLDWKSSIVDLLKLVGMDSSLQARKEMATELGCPANLMGGDYSEMNMWLHREVMHKIAQNGGNIPQDLLKK